jgi:hypothetical protein
MMSERFRLALTLLDFFNRATSSTGRATDYTMAVKDAQQRQE